MGHCTKRSNEPFRTLLPRNVWTMARLTQICCRQDVNAVKEQDDDLLSGLGYVARLKLGVVGTGLYLANCVIVQLEGGRLTSGPAASTLQAAVAFLRPRATMLQA